MEKRVKDGLKITGAFCVAMGVAAACGGASSGSDPAKSAASPGSSSAAASGSAAPAGSSAAGKGPGMEQINALLKEHSRELKACYDREKDRGMAYKGETKFRVKVDSAGKVTDVQGVDTPPAGEFLSSCVTEQMKSWKFPSSGGGSLLNFPVNW